MGVEEGHVPGCNGTGQGQAWSGQEVIETWEEREGWRGAYLPTRLLAVVKREILDMAIGQWALGMPNILSNLSALWCEMDTPRSCLLLGQRTQSSVGESTLRYMYKIAPNVFVIWFELSMKNDQ